MRILYKIITYIIILTLLILAEFYNINFAHNTFLFLLWMWALICFVVLFSDPKDLFKTKKGKYGGHIMLLIISVFIIGLGWFIGLILFALNFSVLIKHLYYEKYSKGEE